MIRSTLISFGLHSFLLTLAYFGLPALKTNEPIELPIDIVEDTPISSKTSLKLGEANVSFSKNKLDNNYFHVISNENEEQILAFRARLLYQKLLDKGFKLVK